MDRKLVEILRYIDREVSKLEQDNIQMSDLYNRNPKGKEIERLKKISDMIERIA